MKRRIVLTIKELKIQIILLIISIFLICKFSSAPLLFKWMAFFLRPQEETMGFELFRIMESLSLAYIASLIFYLVVDFVPKKKAEEKAFELLKPHLVSLFMWMNEINSYFKCVMNVTDFSTVSQEKIEEIDDFYFTNESKFFVEISYRNGMSNRSDMAVFHGAKEIRNSGKSILKVYKDMDAISATVVQASSELIELLSKIRSSGFLNQIIHNFKDKEESLDGEEIICRYLNFYRDIAEFSSLEVQLAQYDFDKITVEYKEATQNEIKEWIEMQIKMRKEHPEIEKYLKMINSNR